MWTFTDATATKLLRRDGADELIGEVTNSTLMISLNWCQNMIGTGRNSSKAGEHVFILIVD